MPKLLRARPPRDPDDEQKVRRLARARHAFGCVVARARMVVRSWEGARVATIAAELRATRRPCASAWCASTPRDWTVWATDPAPGAGPA